MFRSPARRGTISCPCPLLNNLFRIKIVVAFRYGLPFWRVITQVMICVLPSTLMSLGESQSSFPYVPWAPSVQFRCVVYAISWHFSWSGSSLPPSWRDLSQPLFFPGVDCLRTSFSWWCSWESPSGLVFFTRPFQQSITLYSCGTTPD